MPECRHCPDGHDNPRSKPWGVYVASTRDGDGPPATLHVAPSNGSHVAESDADWLRSLIRGDSADAAAIIGEVLAPLHARLAATEFELAEAIQQRRDAEAAAEQGRAEERAAIARMIRSHFAAADAAVDAAAIAVASHPWDTTQRSAHQDHVHDAGCAVCQGDVPALVAVALKAAAPLIAAQARREAAEQIAHRIQERRCTFRACNACLCRAEDAQAALAALDSPEGTP